MKQFEYDPERCFRLTCHRCRQPFGTIVSKDAGSLNEARDILIDSEAVIMCAHCSDRIYRQGIEE